jgi:hypothetical protein
VPIMYAQIAKLDIIQTETNVLFVHP